MSTDMGITAPEILAEVRQILAHENWHAIKALLAREQTSEGYSFLREMFCEETAW